MTINRQKKKVPKLTRLAVLCGGLLLGAAACKSSPPSTDDAAGEPAPSTSKPEEAREPADHEVEVYLVSDAIREGGEPVVPLETGRVDVKHKKGGRDGLEIVPLRERMETRVGEIRDLGLHPRLVIRSWPAIPYRTLMEVVYTGTRTKLTDVPRGQPTFKLAITEPDTQGGEPDFAKFGIPKLKLTAADYKRRAANDEPPVDLTVAIGAEGIRVAAQGRILDPKEGCPDSGPTLCLADDSIDIQELIDRAKKAYADGRHEEGRRALDKALQAYDFARLYNQLVRIKKEYPDEHEVKLSADPGLPVEVLMELFKRIRWQLQKDDYDSSEAYRTAYRNERFKQRAGRVVPLFPDPTISIAK